KTAGVTHVAMLSYETEFVQFWNQAAEMEYFPVFIGADGWGDAKVLQSKLFADASKHRAVAYQSAYWKADASHSEANRFRQAFRKKFGREPNAWSAVSYDAGSVLLEAVRRISGPLDA